MPRPRLRCEDEKEISGCSSGASRRNDSAGALPRSPAPVSENLRSVQAVTQGTLVAEIDLGSTAMNIIMTDLAGDEMPTEEGHTHCRSGPHATK